MPTHFKHLIDLCLYIVILVFFAGCKKDRDHIGVTKYPDQQSFTVSLPQHFAPFPNEEMTVEKVELGRHLFYDPILSKDSSQSCSSCHKQENSFSDPNRFSLGVEGIHGDRQSMALINLAWSPFFFWDGRARTAQEQALGPVPNPIEMNLPWKEATQRIKRHPYYSKQFLKYYRTTDIDSTVIADAIGQFVKSIVSYQSKADQVFSYDPPYLSLFTPDELAGLDIFKSQVGECFHCHAGSKGDAELKPFFIC